MTLNEMLDMAEQSARRMKIGTKDDLIPLWLIFDEKGKSTVAGTPWRDNDEKVALLAIMQEQLRKMQATAYVLTVEYWFSDMPRGTDMSNVDPMNFRPLVMPRDDPKRGEAMLFQACSRAEMRLRTCEILRDTSGRCCELKRFGGDRDKFEGPLAKNLLQFEGPMLQ